MRRTVIITSIVAAAAAAVTINAAQASQVVRSSGSDEGGHVSYITVVERATSDTYVDLGPSGDSRGDLIAFGNRVYDKTNTRQVGTDHGSCIRTVVGKAWECSFTIILRGGSLVVEGPFYDKHDSVLAITGGTGIYSRAGGEMRLHARDAVGSAFTFSFTIEH